MASLFPVLVQTAVADVSYDYDTAGRLLYIFDGNGNMITYTDDLDGNITNIATTPLQGFVVKAFSPIHGPSGTQVTIFGNGFSTTPSGNTVTFNGTPATVISSTVSTITTTVPAGATTGAVYVSSPPNGAGSAPTNFTIP